MQSGRAAEEGRNRETDGGKRDRQGEGGRTGGREASKKGQREREGGKREMDWRESKGRTEGLSKRILHNHDHHGILHCLVQLSSSSSLSHIISSLLFKISDLE